MAYKRYIKIGGKLYGPYEYHSYRASDGSVKSHYLKKVEHENLELKKKIKFLEVAVSGLMIVLLFLVILYVSKPQITGRLVLDLDKETFDLNETVGGQLKMDLAEGEFYPADSIIRINFNGQSQELTLEQFVNMTGGTLEKQEQDFYIIRGPQVEGHGNGYGFLGFKEIPVDVLFQLEISPAFLNITENITKENITNITNVTNITNETNITNVTNETNVTNITEENITNITEVNISEGNITEGNVTENVTERNVTQPEGNETGGGGEGNVTEIPPETPPEQPPEIPPETPPEIPPEQPPETPVEGEAPSCETPEAALTGEAIGESRTIDGNCSAEREFAYHLDNETATLVCGSVRTESENLSDSDVNVDVEHDQVKVTTDYKEKIEGFGSEFLTGKEQVIDLNLSTFNFTADKEGTYILNLEMIYNNVTIMQTAAQVIFLNLTTNVSHIPRLIQNIPDIYITKNSNATLNLGDYFEDPDNDTLSFNASPVENISIKFEDNYAIIVPEENFTGTRHVKFYASDGENETESNLVAIEVMEALNYTIKVIDKKGVIKDEIFVNETKIEFELSKIEKNGIKSFEASARAYKSVSQETEEEILANETNITEENISQSNISITGLATSSLTNQTGREIYNSTINFIALSNNTIIQIDQPTKSQESQGIATEIFAIEPSEEIEIESATITLEKTPGANISKIFSCSDWDVADFDCDSAWIDTNLSFEQDNNTVTFNVSKFSAYAGFSQLLGNITITLISNTEQCLVDCEAVIDIYIPESIIKKKVPGTGKLMLEKVSKTQSKLVKNKEVELQDKSSTLKLEKEHWLDSDIFDIWFLKTTESNDLIDFSVKKLVNVTLDKTVYDYGPCVNQKSNTSNGATLICVVGNHIEKINASEWRDFLNEGLDVGHNIVKIEGKKQVKEGENNIDWKISVNLSSLNVSTYYEPNLAWWNSSWSKRAPINIWDSSVATTANYSVRMNVSYDSDMQNDFDDLRFTDDDNTTELDYWLQEKSNGAWALVWVEIKDIINATNQTIYMYYGNSGASTKSNISKAFLFGDDFNDNSIGSSWMNNTGPWYEQNGIMFINTSTWSDVSKIYINTTGGITSGFAVIAKVRPDSFDSDYRMGVSAKHDWDGSGDGYNLLVKYDNLSSLVYLDDWSAWGNEINPGFTFSTSTWYWFEMALTPSLMFGDDLKGRSWQVGSTRPDWQVNQTWSSRTGATAGMDGGYISLASFDDFILRKFVDPEPSYAINVSAEQVNIVVNSSSPACTIGENYYSTIQAAINAATDGATITVCSGTYTENINVNKTVSIVSYSQNPSDTIVQATSTSNHAFNVTKNSSTIRGFTVRNSNYGIYLNNNIYYTTISNINFSANTRAIYIYNSKNNTISNINVTATANNVYGVYFDSTSNFNSLSGANIILSGSGSYAIALTSSSNNTINGNNATLYNTISYGVYIYSSSSDNIVNNTIIKTNGSSSHGIYLYSGCSRNVINLNTINVTGSGSNGIYGYQATSDKNNITNNLIQKAEKGIYLLALYNTLIKNNTILNANTGIYSYGIYLYQCDNNTLQENQINSSRYGLYIEGTDKWDFNNTIDTTNKVNGYAIYYYNNYASNIDCSALDQSALSNTNVTAGEIGKITVANSQNIVLENCNISNENTEGNAVSVPYSNNVTVRNLNSTNNQYTVYLESTNNSNISNVNSSGFKGIYLYNSSNNFVENTKVNTTTSSTGNGIYLYSYSINNTIRNNDARVFNSGTVLRIESYSTANNISNNNFTSNCSSCYGVYFGQLSNNNNMSYNIINTTGSTSYGLFVSDSHNLTENYDIIYTSGLNAYGIYPYSGDDNKINNTVVKTTNTNAHGIYCYSGADRNIINNNTVNATGSGAYGIGIYYGTNRGNNLTNNIIQKSSYGIYLGGGPVVDTLVKNNTILNATNYGIQITTSENNTLQENQINSSRYGLYIDGTDALDFNHSIDTTNLVNGLKIYYYNKQASRNVDCGTLDQATLQGNNITAGEIGKITIANSNTFTLENCNISNENSEGNAVSVPYSNNVTVRNLNSTNNQYTVYLEGTNNSNFSNINSSGFKGIYLYNSSNNFVENDRVNTTGSSGYGVYLFTSSSNNTVRDNVLRTTSAEGITIATTSINNNLTSNTITTTGSSSYTFSIGMNCNNNTVSYNNLSTYGSNSYVCYINQANNITWIYNNLTSYNTGLGMYMAYADDNNVSHNTITTNASAAHGIYLYGDSDRNNFYNNTVNVTGANTHGVYTYYSSVTRNNFTGNIIYATGSGDVGIYFANPTTNATVINNTIDGNRTSSTAWAFRFDINNSATNTFTGNIIKGDNASADTNVTFTYNGSVTLKGVATLARPSNPGSYNNINKYVNATNNSANSWLYLNISYNNSDVSVVDENTLFIARNNGSWETNTSKFSSTSGVNTSANYVYANITNFSTFAPLGSNKSGCIGTNYVFACGDTVNESCTMNGNSSATGTCLIVGANNIVIDGAGYTINYSSSTTGYGVDNSGGFDNVTVKNCVIKQTNASVSSSSGVYLNNSDNSSVYNNSISGASEYGIKLESSLTNNITGNSLSSNYEGIRVGGNNTVVQSNTVGGGGSAYGGIYVTGSSNVTVKSNTITSQSWRGILISSSGNVIRDNPVSSSGHNIWLTGDNNNVTNNTLNMGTYCGICMENVEGSILTNNSGALNENGIKLAPGSNNTFTNNNIGGNTAGIWMESSSTNNTFVNTTASGTTYGIILLTSSNNNSYREGTIGGISTNGIYLDNSQGNVFQDSSISATTNHVYSTNANSNNTVLNCSFDKSKININGGVVYFKWYLDSYVNYSNGTAVDNATVYAWDKYGALTFTKLTGQGLPNSKSKGWTDMTGNVLLLHMDESSGTIVDYSGEGNDGTNNGATYGVSGKFNTALRFDGDNDYVNVPADTSLKPSNITIEFWFKTDKLTTDVDWFGIIQSAYGDGYSNGWRILDYNNAPAIQMNFGDAGPSWVSGSSITLGRWYHIVVTYDHQYLRLYQDGAQVGTPVAETRDINWGSSADMQVGLAQFYFNGTLDEVAVYNRALSATEIAQHYNASGHIERQNTTEYYQNSTSSYYSTNYSMKAIKSQSPIQQVNLTTNQQVNLTLDSTNPLIYFVSPTPQNNTRNKSTENSAYVNVTVEEDSEHSAYIDWNKTLRGYWKFDENSGTNAEDSSGNGNNGTLYNDANWTVFAKRGNAVVFDGNGDYARVTSDNGLNIRDALTVEMWIYPRSFKTSSPYISGLAERKTGAWDQWIVRLGDSSLAATRVQFVTTTSGGLTKLNGATDLAANNWYHIAVTWSTADNTKRIYINGVQEAGTQGTSGQLNDLADGYVDIGIDAGSATRVFNGTIDEIKVYARALSPEEINASYNNGLYRLYHNFTNLSGGSYEYRACAQDESGNSNCTETRILKINRVPTQVNLSLPANGNETENHTTNRTSLFNWTTATDADNDSLQYVWNLTCYNSIGGACSPTDNRLVENLTNNNYTPTNVLKNFWDTLDYYNWSVKAWDGLEYGETSDVWQLYIDSLVALSTINSTSAFGNLVPGTVNDTTDNAPWPISFQNDGNCFVNVSIKGAQLWTATPESNESYQYKFDYLEQNSFNWSGSVTDWANVPIGLTVLSILNSLNYTDTNDSAELDIRLAPLDYEPAGAKSSNINLTGSFVDVAE